MANKKIDINVDINSSIDTSKKDFQKLKQEKAFEGKQGSKRYQTIQGLLTSLEGIDFSKLKGKELTIFLNTLLELRKHLDKASQSLNKYTEEQKKLLEKQEEAERQLKTANDARQTSQQRRKKALNNVDLKNYQYINKETGRKVENVKTINDLLQKNQLNITGPKGGSVNQQAVLNETGLAEYSEATRSYTAAVEAVKRAKEELEKATKAVDEMGEASVSPVTKSIAKNSNKTRNAVQKFKDLGAEKDEEDLKKAEEQRIKSANLQSSALGRAFKQFTIYSVVIRSIKTALREAVQTVKELDKYLTEQAMVTGMTREQTYGLVKSYQELALQCGATTKEIAQVSTEYMKQGKSIQESLVLTEAAVKAAKVARVSVGDSVNYLTTALNGFRLSAEDAMKVSDKFAAVAAASATDYDELAIALSKVASQANLAGMSIDYTTALLTKGLETTREAPETMGTALKTIIARMRELGDYGETLEGDTDINNVESQLAYVGIALRDTNGELRSTEDVLDELGKKWDTLNKNQQAALAKALAGTRQQSRLIAMMDDYERVIELQQIAERSEGATAAQAGVYLEGIEASLNKIQVAWEKIVMTITESEIIIGLLNGVGKLLENIGAALEHPLVTLGMFGPLIVAIIAQLLQKWELQKSINRSILEEEKTKRAELIINKKNSLAQKEAYLTLLKARKKEEEITKEKAQQALLDNNASNDAAAQAIYEKAMAEELSEKKALDDEIAKTQKEIKLESAEIAELQLEQYQTEINILQNGRGITSIFGNMLGALTPVLSLMQLMNGAQLLFLSLQKKEKQNIFQIIKAKKKENKEKGKSVFLGIVEALGTTPAGLIAGIALATTLVTALGLGIMASLGVFNVKTKAEKRAEEINELSNEIYQLTEKANKLEEVSNKFEDIDSKIIKTNEDLKEMNSLIESTADLMSDEVSEDKDEKKLDEERYGGKGVTQKEAYQIAVQDGNVEQWLEDEEQYLRDKANERREKQLKLVLDTPVNKRGEYFDENTTKASIKQTQAAIKAINVNTAYEYLDSLKDQKKITDEAATATENLTTALLKNLSVKDAFNYTQSETAVESLVNTLIDLTMVVEELNGDHNTKSIAEVLTSDSYTLKEQVEAYNLAIDALEGIEEAAFKAQYAHMEFWTQLKSDVLDFIETSGITTDEVNDWYKTGKKIQQNDDFWKNLEDEGVSSTGFQEIWEQRFKEYITTVKELNGDIAAATRRVFGEYLGDSEENMKYFLNAYAEIVQVGALNMGQNMDKIKNTIESFYEKALKWNELSESEKSQFVQDNADMFSDGSLLEAFESGDYKKIEAALSNNEALKDQIKKRRDEIEQELKIERERPEKEQNKAYIAELEAYEDYLNDTLNLFKASVKIRLEQEQKQLDEYKKMKEKERDALVESLEKRKEAYEKYFEEIADKEEDEDFEDESNRLISNISKIASSSDAESKKQTLELEQELRELEEQRIEALKERAREAILENMDDQVEDINKKFDELLENNKALLAAMTGDLENPAEFLSKMIGSKFTEGLTETEFEDWMGTMQITYGNVLDGIDWEAVTTKVMEQYNLQVNGQDITLSESDSQTFYSIVKSALAAVGIR